MQSGDQLQQFAHPAGSGQRGSPDVVLDVDGVVVDPHMLPTEPSGGRGRRANIGATSVCVSALG